MTDPITYPYYLGFSDRYGIIFTHQTYGRLRLPCTLVFDWQTSETIELKLVHPLISPKSELQIGDLEVFHLSHKYFFVRMRDYHFKVNATFKGSEEGVEDLVIPPIEKCQFDAYKSIHQQMKKKREQAPNVGDGVGVECQKQKQKALSMYARGLDIVLKDRPRDFTIKSNDCGSFPVHWFLLANLWPFFSTASTVDMIEKNTRTLLLPFPKRCVEVLVAFFYGKDVGALSWDSSITLLEMSALYDIPELKAFATESVISNTEPLTLARALRAWKVANESNAGDVERFLTAFLKKHMSEIEGSEESRMFTESQLLELLLQVVRV